MTSLNSSSSSGFRLRHAVVLAGLGLLIGSLLGARALTGHGEEKGEQPRSSQEKMVGPVVNGLVDSNPQPIPYGLPSVLQSGTVVKVFVKDGDSVKADDKLYKFDTSPLEKSLDVAQKGVDVAQTKVAEAKDALEQHAEKVKSSELAVKLAQRKKDLNGEKYNLVRRKLEDYYRAENPKITKEEIESKLQNEDKLFSAHVDYTTADSEWLLAQRQLDSLEVVAKHINNQIKQAEAGVELARAEAAKVQQAIDLCTIRAKIDGTIEQITIGEGATLGVSTQRPALWLIPSGPRVVRASIEAEFAHRVSSKIIGKEVTIYDDTDPRLTYKGKVRRISGTFLPKRNSNEGLLGSETRSLEAEIDVTDAAPKDRPPLRIGQKVRVDLGQ